MPFVGFDAERQDAPAFQLVLNLDGLDFLEIGSVLVAKDSLCFACVSLEKLRNLFICKAAFPLDVAGFVAPGLSIGASIGNGF